MNRYAVIDADGLVENVILIDSPEDWVAPDNCTTRQLEDGQRCGPGYTYKDGDFVAPPEDGQQR